MEDYWRIRIKYGAKDFTEESWGRDEVGIWYGAWSENDLAKAEDGAGNASEIAARLSDLPNQAQLWPMKSSYVNAAIRFRSIANGAFIVCYL
jgi:hypothetical protein